MTEIDRAVEALKAAVKQNGIDKRVGDVASQFTSYLILLKSSSPSSQSISKLRSILRRPLVPLYAAVPGPALQLSSAVLRKVVDEKLRNALNSQNIQLSTWWNDIAVAVLSGVLDYLDKCSDDMTKETVALAFYPTICTLFFYQDASLILLPRTQRTAYSLLHETLSGHPGNQRRLRDHAVLGGSLIGIAISQSKDYLVIEALLDIVGWLIPITNQTEKGTVKRTEFINDLFGSKKHFSCSSELVNLLQYISSSHWEDTVMKIMDALARSDIMFPQSFALDEVDVCGKLYPQPTAFDRLHLDREFFLVNIVQQDDVCDSLKISYDHIHSVTIDVSKVPPHSKVIVHVDLKTSPSIGDVSLDIPAGQKLYLKFEIQREDLSRLMEALRRRGIVKLNFLGENPPKQGNKRRSVGLAHGIRLSGDSSPPPQGSQYEDKVKHVENVYETNFLDDARSNTAHFEQESTSQAPPRMPVKEPEVQESKNDASVERAPKTVAKPRPVSKSAKKVVVPLPVTPPRKSPAKDDPPSAIHVSVFGESDDELSEISDDELPKPVADVHHIVHPAQIVKAEPNLSLSAKSNSFQPAPPTKRIAKRRLIVDSDEDEIRATPKAAQMTTIPAKPDINVETVSKTRRIDDRHSSTLRSSSTIATNHPENIPLEVKRPCTPSSNEASHPGAIDDIARKHFDHDAFLKDASAYVQVPPCKTIPDAELTHGIISTSPMKKNLVTGKRTARRIAPSKPADVANIPAKLAGTRRKWDDANSPTEALKVPEDSHLPKKKARNTTSGNISIKRAASILPDPFEPSAISINVAKAPRKYGKKGKTLSPILPENVDFDEVPGAALKKKTNARAKAVRASKPAQKKVPTPISGRETRTSVMRRRNEKPPEFESSKEINRKLQPPETNTGILAALEPVDQITKVEPFCNDATSGSTVFLKPESALREQANKMDMEQLGSSTKTKTGNSNAVITETKPSPTKRARTPKPKKAPWEDPVFIAQHAPADEVKSLGVSPTGEDPIEPIQDIVSGEVDEALFGDFIDYSVSLKGSEDPILPASSDIPPLQSTPLKPPICIDLTLDSTPVKNYCDSAKDRGVAKDVGMLPSKGPDPVESFETSAAVPVALHVTGRQDSHGTCIGVSKSSTDVTTDVIMSQDPSLLPILSRNKERRERLSASNISPTCVRTNDAEDPLAEPCDVMPSPSVLVRRRQSVVSFASPLVTRPNSDDASRDPHDGILEV
ncbi:uncharacterized protein EDB93DRAFT_455734 [Suillus bovinus]|uniref:uncharacterized protein n=1 Tax=Suillus bovinus TaxID=48563 RepID=UPI001B88684F|nr:uncharacterized protein EDB93DRAFT_455734 [Suillus bovinus]KAG2146912.1 hypothetical protein EDB93DRAFT_455734 [Suillus bovinus]